jgi:phage terminase large subunit-like protein
VLLWMMDNINISTGLAGNIKPDKAKSSEKIDEAVALIMALDQCIRNEGVDEISAYGERGLLIL